MMNGFFRIDGPFYKFGNILYYLIISNILWVIFSLPLFTMGASTTALFYVMGRVVRNDDVDVFRNFWSSFKLNFKQSTLIWIILAAVSSIVYVNIKNVYILGSISKYVLPVQLVIAFEIVILVIYVFPVLSRFDMGIMNLFKTSLLLGNKHLLTTLLCIVCLFINSILLYFIPGILILVYISLNALCLSFLIHKIFNKYMLQDDTKAYCDNSDSHTNNVLQ